MFSTLQHEKTKEKASNWIESIDLENPTPQQMEEVYFVAYRLYEEKRYQDSLSFFRLLTSMEMHYNHWLGLGACYQKLKEYQQAIKTYQKMLILFQDQPLAYVHVYMADCYFMLQDSTEGLKALEAALQETKQTQDQRIKDHVAFMKALWKEKK